jgi:flagellar biosynthesis protein FlhA
MGRQIVQQLFMSPRVLGVTAGILIMLGLIPGMPHIVFLVIGAAFGYGAWTLYQRQQAPAEPEAPPAPPTTDGEATWDDLQPVDLLGLELGYRLISLVDKNRQGDLLTRIKGVRRKFAQEVGFLPPAVHVRDNLELKPSAYRITLRGVVVGEGEAFPGMFLAINPGGITTPLIGTPTTDPAFGLPAHWIDDRQKEAAQMAGFTVVDSETVMATHLSHLMQVQAAKLLSRTETQQLVEHVASWPPSSSKKWFRKWCRSQRSRKFSSCCWKSLCTSATSAPSSKPWPSTLVRCPTLWSWHARAHCTVARHRPADLRPHPRTQRHRHRARAGAPAGAGLGNAAGPALDPGVADILTRRPPKWP